MEMKANVDWEEEYYFRFKKFPPKIIGIPEENPYYQALLSNAVTRGSEITGAELDEMAKAVGKYDLDAGGANYGYSN